MNLSKIINRLNPSAPRSCSSSEDLVEAATDASDKKNQTVEVRSFDAATSIEIDNSYAIPVSAEDYILAVDQRKHYKLSYGERYLFTLESAIVYGPDGDIVSGDKIALTDFSPQNGKGCDHSLFSRRRFSKPLELANSTLSLVTPFSSNYYHWLLEALPNLRAIDLTTVDQILIPSAQPFHLQALELLGVPAEKIIQLHSNSGFRCEKLLIASYHRSVSAAPGAVKWVAQQLGELAGNVASSKPSKRLYITRGDGSWRGVENEAAVINLLSEYGFSAVTLSKLSVLEQISLFRESTHIISVHGAGLANLAFAKVGTLVLEILPPRWTSLCFAHLAKNVGCKYKFMIAAPLGLSQEQLASDRGYIPLDNISQSQSLKIPLDKLSLYLQQESIV